MSRRERPRLPVRIDTEDHTYGYLEMFIDADLLAVIDKGFEMVKHLNDQTDIANVLLIGIWDDYVIRHNRYTRSTWRVKNKITPIRFPKRRSTRQYFLRLKFFPSTKHIVGIEVHYWRTYDTAMSYYIELTKDEVEELRALLHQHLAGLYGNKATPQETDGCD